MAIKAVLFDLGDTLLNFGKVDIDGLFAQGARLSYDYLRDCVARGNLLPKFGWYRRRNILAIKLHYFWSKITDREFDCLALLERQVRGLGIRATPKQLEELAWLWYQPLARTARIEPDLHRRLRDLQDMSLKLAVVSNTFIPASAHDRHLQWLDLLQFFPVRIYSSATVFRKPDRRIFQRALDALQVKAGSAVMVGDKWHLDIKGARKVGLATVFKRGPLNRSRKVPADASCIDNIGELPALIRRWPEWGGSC